VGAQSYREQYGVNTIYLVPTNLYGPRDNFDLETSHVIPALVRKMVEARLSGAARVVLWSDGSQTREFLYVEDCAEALVLAAQRYDGAEPVNLGSEEEVSIRDLARLVAELTGFTGERAWDASKPGGQPRRRLDVSRAGRSFGFRARTPLRLGLERTVAWYSDSTGDPVAASLIHGSGS
jgi:GDP-L-fucose synthase